MPTALLADTTCEECSLPVAAIALIETVEGDQLCRSCAAEIPRCDECGTPARERRLTVDGTWLCSECRIGWHRCQDCEHYTRDITAIISGNDVCEDCRDRYSTCDDCGAYAADTVYVDDGDQVCSTCEYDNYHECADCTTLVCRTDSYCSSCEHSPTGHPHIHDYDYKPDPVFHGDGPLFLGLELELKTPRHVLDEAADTAVEHLRGLGYLKEDGSIQPCGFELVTHPMSYAFAREQFPWSLLTRLRLLGAYTDDGVGIHIHLSRAGFTSPGHIYRWLKFVYRNEAAVTTLARRRSSQWAEFSPDARARAADDAKSTYRRDIYIPRYEAVNVRPTTTFELRIFASSLKPQQVKAALAFAAASVEYTRDLAAAQIARRRGWEWSAFCAWVANRRPAYAPLLAEMEALRCAS
ncbi:hypothetical protein [Nocardia farcinica]|uniref:hypothetical protein n=1 Tax=Nocardia farcinica TaxID=37329 RepID=UPI0024573D9A|nr:hypothetical protein [Nocardia farcinica]